MSKSLFSQYWNSLATILKLSFYLRFYEYPYKHTHTHTHIYKYKIYMKRKHKKSKILAFRLQTLSNTTSLFAYVVFLHFECTPLTYSIEPLQFFLFSARVTYVQIVLSACFL